MVIKTIYINLKQERLFTNPLTMTQKEIKEFVVLKEDVKHIKQDVKETKEDVSSINTTMTKLTSKLFNDDETGEVGYIEATRKNGIRLTKLENIKIAMLFIYGAIWGVLGAIIKSRL